MKVCCITFTHTLNYGSGLQAYALQEVISHIRTGEEDTEYAIMPIMKCRGYPSTFRGLKEIAKRIGKLYFRIPLRPFEKKYMHFAKPIPIKYFRQLNEEYDAFVCGSDTIWNPDVILGRDEYYLNFATKYSFSYAASFGRSDIDQSLYQKIRKNLENLDSISVRENISADIARACTDKPVSVVVDPVMLLNAEEWNKVANTNQRGEKYILYYAAGVFPLLEQFVRLLQRITGLRIVYAVSNGMSAIKKHKFWLDSQGKWLQLIRDAEYVVTNSFHATSFSIIYKKEFFSIGYPGKASGLNMRMENILQAVGLSSRLFYEMPETIDLSDIDYDAVYEKLKPMRDYSLNYLRENLEEAYRRKKEAEN